MRSQILASDISPRVASRFLASYLCSYCEYQKMATSLTELGNVLKQVLGRCGASVVRQFEHSYSRGRTDGIYNSSDPKTEEREKPAYLVLSPYSKFFGVYSHIRPYLDISSKPALYQPPNPFKGPSDSNFLESTVICSRGPVDLAPCPDTRIFSSKGIQARDFSGLWSGILVLLFWLLGCCYITIKLQKVDPFFQGGYSTA